MYLNISQEAISVLYGSSFTRRKTELPFTLDRWTAAQVSTLDVTTWTCSCFAETLVLQVCLRAQNRQREQVEKPTVHCSALPFSSTEQFAMT